MDQSSKWPARIDLRPNGELEFIRECHSAMTLLNADSISITDSEISWAPATQANYKSALEVKNVKNLVKHNFRYQDPSGN
jgi:hypothetical protein